MPESKTEPKLPELSQEKFLELLEEILDEESGGSLLSIPGLYEVVSEHFNNEVLERYALETDHLPDCPCEDCVSDRELEAEDSETAEAEDVSGD